MHTTEKHHSADDRTLSDAELDQVSGGITLEEYFFQAWYIGTIPHETAKLGPGLQRR